MLSKLCNSQFLWIEVLKEMVQILSWFYFWFHFSLLEQFLSLLCVHSFPSLGVKEKLKTADSTVSSLYILMRRNNT